MEASAGSSEDNFAYRNISGAALPPKAPTLGTAAPRLRKAPAGGVAAAATADEIVTGSLALDRSGLLTPPSRRQSLAPVMATSTSSPLSAGPPSASLGGKHAIPSSSSSATSKRTPTQLVLQNVFARFVRIAEMKVNTLIYTQPLDREVDLFAPICAGADASFDCLLESMGSVAKHCPKLMIDSIMVWRKSKSETSGNEGTRNITAIYPHLKGKDLEYIVKERKSLVSNFILCRVLIAIVQRLTRETLPDDLEEKLEDMVFGQLRNADPEMTVRSVNRQANIDLFAELVGALSNIRFSTVSGRFITELNKASTVKEGKLDLIIRSMRFLKLKIYPMDALEDTAEFLQTCAELFQNAHSTRIKHAYAEVFVMLLEPIAAVATAEVNLPAWMKTVELIYPKASKMLGKPRHLQAALPLISTLLCVSRKDFFHRHWGDFTDLCFKQLRDKQLRTTALSSLTRLIWVYLFRCSETSTTNVYRRIESMTRILFPTNRRGVVPAETSLQAFIQIVYFVCVRYPEYGIDNILTNLLGIEHGAPMLSGPGATLAASAGSLINASSVLTGGKDYASSANSVPSTYLDDWTTNTTMSGSTPTLVGSNMVVGDTIVNPERLIIALRAFLLLLADMEEALGGGTKESNGITAGTVSAVHGSASKVVVEGKVNLAPPPFPPSDTSVVQSYIDINFLNKIRDRNSSIARRGDIRGLLSESIVARMGTSMRDSMDRFNDSLGTVALALDNLCGWSLLTDTGMLSTIAALGPTAGGTLGIRRGSISDTATSTGSTGGSDKETRASVVDVVSRDRQLLFDLIHTYLDCLPRIAPTGLGPVKVIELLSRYVLHADDGIQIAAREALKRICLISSQGDVGYSKFWNFGEGKSVASEVVRIVAETGVSILNDRYGDILGNLAFDGAQGATWAFTTNYIALLGIWVKQIQDSPQLWDPMEADWVVEEIESRGLLFLCSLVPFVRRQALVILSLAEKFETALKGRGPDSEDQLAGLSKAEARRETLRRQSRNDLRRRYTLQRSLFNPHMEVRRTRLGRIMEECGPDLVRRHYHDPVLAASTRSEHQKLQQQQRQQQYLNIMSAKDTLLHVAGSDIPQDMIIWARCFPDLIKWCFQYASPRTMQLCLRDVCARLLVLQPSLIAAADQTSTGTSSKGNTNITGTVKWVNDRTGLGISATSGKPSGPPLLPMTDDMVDQWKVHMVYACACIEINRAADGDARMHSVIGVTGSYLDRSRGEPLALENSARNGNMLLRPIGSARQLFQMVFPLMSSERSAIRQAAVTSLGAIHWLSYQTFLEDVQPYMRSVVDDLRTRAALARGEIRESSRKAGSSQALAQSAQTKRFERVRMELTHVLSLVADFVTHVQYRRNETLMAGVITYVRELARFLSDQDVQLEWDHQMLRYYFSGFVERFYDHLVAAVEQPLETPAGYGNQSERRETVEQYLSFDLRLGLFRLFEKWCGYGQFSSRTRDREAKMMLSILDQVKDIRERGALTSTMEEQRKALETASLKAMAALCKGPVLNTRDPDLSFEFRTLVAWIDSIFSSPDEKFHVIARAALEALLTHNRMNEQLLIDVVRQCYVGDINSNVTLGYFMALVDIFVREDAYPCTPSRMCALALYKMGDPNLHIRRGAVRLLRAIEDRFWGDRTARAKYGAVKNLVKEFFGPPPQLADLEAHMMEREYDHEGWDDEAAMMAAMALIDEEHATYEAAAVTSSLPIVYKYAQALVSARLASERLDMTYEMLSEMVLMSNLVATGNGVKAGNPQGVRDILIFMVPWVRNVELVGLPSKQPGSSSSLPRTPTETVLTNLFFLTVKYADEHVTEMEHLWMQLVEPVPVDNDSPRSSVSGSAEGLRNGLGDDDNTRAIIDRHTNIAVEFLLGIGVKKRNPKFVTHAKKVMVYLARTSACAQLVDGLIARITPKNLVPSGLEDANSGGGGAASDSRPAPIEVAKLQKTSPQTALYMADLEQVLVDMPKRPAFSTGQLACVLLVDLAVEVGAALRPHLALLLHVIFVQLDHFITLICEQNRLLLINIIQSTVPRDVAGEHIDTVHAALSLKEGKRLWAYEDVTPKNPDIESQHLLGALVVDVLDLFLVVDPELAQTWGETALAWGTSCPVRHVACRSLQIFRTLMPAFSQRMLGELLQRLANTLADPTEEIQGFALELITTLSAMIDSLDRSRLVMFPQFFWAAIACIHSPHEWEFSEGVVLVEKILQKLDVQDPACRNILLVNLPSKWKGQFSGLQPLLMRGLCSSSTEKHCLRIINSLVSLEDPALVEPSNSRVLFALLSNLPRWLQCFEADYGSDGGKEAGVTPAECMATAQALAEFAGVLGHQGFSRLLSSYAKRKFRTKDDFLHQFMSLLTDAFFPAHEAETLQFLMGLLSNSHHFYRRSVLAVIKIMLPSLGPGRATPTMLGAVAAPPRALNTIDEELIAPLLAILQTDLAAEALDVLDEALAGTISIGESNLRLVFGGKSIYKIAREGVPGMEGGPPSDGTHDEGSGGGTANGTNTSSGGWWVKDFAATARVARYNMTGVASTCGGGRDLYTTIGAVGGKLRDGQINRADASLRASPASTVLVGGSMRRVPQAVPDLGDVTGTSMSLADETPDLWTMNDLDGELLNTLNDLDAFFGRDEDYEVEFGHQPDVSRATLSAVAVKSNRFSTASSDAASSSDILNVPDAKDFYQPFEQEPSASSKSSGPARKASMSSLLSEVSYTTEPLGAGMTRDTSMSSLFVNGILGEYFPDGTAWNGEEGGPNPRRQQQEPSRLRHALHPPPPAQVSPARRLLSHPDARAYVTFRVRTSYAQLVQDPEFAHWLRHDLSQPLRVDIARLVVDKVEADPASTDSNPGVLVTVTIQAGERDDASAGGVESAAYAEDLAALIFGDADAGEEDRDDRERLGEGVITHNLDRTWKPEILLGFMGITVPYLAEGLRYELPHRSRPARSPRPAAQPHPQPQSKSPSHPVGLIPPPRGVTRDLAALQRGGTTRSSASSPLPPASASPRLDRSIESVSSEVTVTPLSSTRPPLPMPPPLTAASAAELLRIFPASFELAVQLIEDWIEFATDLLSLEDTGASQPSSLRAALDRMTGLFAEHHHHGEGGAQNGRDTRYRPISDEDQASGAIAARLISCQRDDPALIAGFISARARHVETMNTGVKSYLAARHAMTEHDEEDSDRDDAGSMSHSVDGHAAVELARSLLELYIEVLRLQGLLETFLDVPSEPRNRELMAAEQCMLSLPS
ncbi:Cell morphogenesis protein PAG1 [Geranomyces michiganensis]|nr:Cell morphogenesis protein PAG1 [Geranomyces michiganensis]